MKLLYVTGNDLSAFYFSRQYKKQEELLEVWNKCQLIPDKTFYQFVDDNYFEATAMEFEKVDPKFITFIYVKMIDEDLAKDRNFFIIEDVEKNDKINAHPLIGELRGEYPNQEMWMGNKWEKITGYQKPLEVRFTELQEEFSELRLELKDLRERMDDTYE